MTVDNTSPPAEQNSQHRNTALATAAVGIIFTCVFLGLLLYNGHQHYVVGLQQENDLAAQKTQLLQEPENTALLTEIREHDLQIRGNKLSFLTFSSRAGVMLLFSALVMLGAFKWIGTLNGIRPQPSPDAKMPPQIHQQNLGRYGVAVVALVLIAGTLYLQQDVPQGFMLVDTAQAAAEPESVTAPTYASPEALAKNWHRFRGFAGAGVTPLKDIPTQWDETAGTGILWKTKIPIYGHNSPVVWQDRIFLSGATDDKRVVYCINAQDGKILWTGDVPTVPPGEEELEVMEDTGLAACTVATDGARVYAIFATGDVAAFDFKGKRLWHKNLGIPDSAYGYATSLEVWKDRVLVQYDEAYPEDKKSRMIAFDGATGKIVWDKPRPVGNGWTSPIVAPVGQTYQLITVGAPWVIGYDPNDGKELWRAEVVDGDVAPSPVLIGNKVIAIEPYSQTVALRVDGQGNVTESHVEWINEDGAPDIASPLTDDQRLYLMDTGGLLFCINGQDGKLLWEHDFEESVQASPSLAGGKLYILAENGVMFIGTGDNEGFKLETKNLLGEGCFASPAFMPGRIYIRGKESLYCIGE